MKSIVWIVLFQVALSQCKSHKEPSRRVEEIKSENVPYKINAGQNNFQMRNEVNKMTYEIPAGTVSYFSGSYNIKPRNDGLQNNVNNAEFDNKKQQLNTKPVNNNNYYYHSHSKQYQSEKVFEKQLKPNSGYNHNSNYKTVNHHFNGAYTVRPLANKVKDNYENKKRYGKGSGQNNVGNFGNGVYKSHSFNCEEDFPSNKLTIKDEEQDLDTSASFKFFVKVPIPVEVPKPYPVHVPRPYPVTVVKPVPFPIVRSIPIPVQAPVPKNFPLFLPKEPFNIATRTKFPFNLPIPPQFPPFFPPGFNPAHKFQEALGVFEEFKSEADE